MFKSLGNPGGLTPSDGSQGPIAEEFGDDPTSDPTIQCHPGVTPMNTTTKKKLDLCLSLVVRRFFG